MNVSVMAFSFDGLVKSQKMHILSFRRKPESSNFNMFWMPDQVRHDEFGLFTESSVLQMLKRHTPKNGIELAVK
jgi:hypothetical protein